MVRSQILTDHPEIGCSPTSTSPPVPLHACRADASQLRVLNSVYRPGPPCDPARSLSHGRRSHSTRQAENGSPTCIGRGGARGFGSWGSPRCHNTRSIDSGLKIMARTRRRPPQGQRRISVRNTRCTSSDHNSLSGRKRRCPTSLLPAADCLGGSVFDHQVVSFGLPSPPDPSNPGSRPFTGFSVGTPGAATDRSGISTATSGIQRSAWSRRRKQ